MTASNRRSKRPRVYLITLPIAVCLQLVIFLYYQLSLRDVTSPSSPSLSDSLLREFLSYSPGTTNAIQDNSSLDSTKESLFAVQGINKHPVQSINPTKTQPAAVSLWLDNKHKGATTRHNDRLPDWLKEYITWHGQQRKNLSPDNWKEHKYLVMQCLESDNRCGGTADRLKPIPMLLYLAYEYKRILLIRWQRPAKLEEFLQPPSPGGLSLDWRVPDWLDESLGSYPFGDNVQHLLFHLQKQDQNETVVRSRYQSSNGGADYYNEHVPGPSFAHVYHDVWHAVFEPVPALATIIKDTMIRLDLEPGNYAAAHLRAVYAVKSRRPHTIQQWAMNAVNCASHLRPGGPIYFCSDSKYAVQVIQDYAKEHSRKIVSLLHEKEPLHLEKANWTNRQASEYYDTFVDLYLLGMSKCVAYNVGGFGRWGLLLGYNATCGYEHMSNKRDMNKCEWVDAAQPP
jgi:hypothetical protein